MSSIAYFVTKMGLAGKLMALLLIASCLGVVSGCSKSLTEKEYIEHAKELENKGQDRAAVIELKNALRKNPKNPEARWLLGNLYLTLGQGAEAENQLLRARDLGVVADAVAIPLARAELLRDEFDRILEQLQPTPQMSKQDQAVVHVLRGRAYLGKNNVKEATQEIQAALDVYPGSVEAQVAQARVAMVQGDLGLARTSVAKALAADPKSVAAWELLGDIEQRTGNLTKADTAYTHAIEGQRYPLHPLFKRAVLRVQRGDFNGANTDAQALRKIAPRLAAWPYVEGLLALQQKRYGDAQNAFEQALKANPNFALANYYLGAAHLAQGHLGQAQQYLNEALRVAPSAVSVRLLLGAVMVRQGDMAGAEAVLKPALRRDPKNPGVLMMLGVAATGQGRIQEGAAYIRKVIAAHPDFSAAHVQLGLTLLMQGQRSQGVQELQSAISLDPGVKTAQLLVVMNYLQQGKFDVAVKKAQDWHNADPKDPLPLDLIGLAYLRQNQTTKARDAFNEALKAKPGDLTASYNLADLAIAQGRFDEARSLYNQVLKTYPGHINTLIELAALDGRQGHPEKFVARLNDIIKDHPDAVKPRALLGRYFVQFGEPAKAVALMQQGLQLQPRQPTYLEVLGDAQLLQDQVPDATKTFETLVSLYPNLPQAHYLLAKARAARGDWAAAQRELDEVLKRDPNHVLAKVAKVRVLALQGKTDQAAKVMKEFKATHPEDPEVWAQEGWLAMAMKHYRDAIAAYQGALKRRPNSRWTVSLALAQWQAGQRQQGFATLENWVKQHPDDVLVRFNLANGYMLAGRNTEARAQFEKVVERVPDQPFALNNLAWLLRTNEPHQAMKYAHRAVKIAPNAPSFLDTYGLLLLNSGDVKGAKDILQRAALLAPEAPSIGYHLASALERSGDKTGARKTLEKLLARKQSFPERAKAETLLDTLKGSGH